MIIGIFLMQENEIFIMTYIFSVKIKFDAIITKFHCVE